MSTTLERPTVTIDPPVIPDRPPQPPQPPPWQPTAQMISVARALGENPPVGPEHAVVQYNELLRRYGYNCSGPRSALW